MSSLSYCNALRGERRGDVRSQLNQIIDFKLLNNPGANVLHDF